MPPSATPYAEPLLRECLSTLFSEASPGYARTDTSLFTTGADTHSLTASYGDIDPYVCTVRVRSTRCLARIISVMGYDGSGVITGSGEWRVRKGGGDNAVTTLVAEAGGSAFG